MIVTVAQMKAWEQSFVDAGSGSLLTLATAAAREVVNVVLDPAFHRGRAIVVLCGAGNNGADGYLVARLLYEQQCRVRAIAVFSPRSPLCVEAHAWADEIGGLVRSGAQDAQIGSGCIVIDAVYGTGFHGELPGEVRRVFEAVRLTGADVVAVDIPSGIAADTGVVAPGTLSAAVTVALAAQKPAHLLKPSSAYCGRVIERPIGLCEDAVTQTLFHTTPGLVREVSGSRDAAAHKGAFGRVLIAAGSPMMPGAALLATRAAMRSGAGLTMLASCKEAREAAAVMCTEATHCDADDRDDVIDHLARADACVVGCGLGTDDRALAMLRLVLEYARCPLVIDADGLNLLAQHRELLQTLTPSCVLTPHIGEMARLTGQSTEAVTADRIGIALTFAREHGVTVALKSATTVIASPQGRVYINTTGNPGLAKGGSGDVLAGITGALLARSGGEADEMAAAACWLLGLAADELLPELGDTTLLACDVIDRGLPLAFRSLSAI